MYDSSDTGIESKCVNKAKDMMFKLVVSKNYQESTWNLRLKITSQTFVDSKGMFIYCHSVIENELCDFNGATVPIAYTAQVT